MRSRDMELPTARGTKFGHPVLLLRDFRKSNKQNKVKFPRQLHNTSCNLYAKFHFNRVKIHVDFRWLSLFLWPEVVTFLYA